MIILETTIFTRQLQKLLTDDEYKEFQLALIERPDMGAVIIGSGGLRKVRWTLRGRGKRGGARVIYYWATEQHQLLMLLIYDKSAQSDLTKDQIQILKKIVEAEYK